MKVRKTTPVTACRPSLQPMALENKLMSNKFLRLIDWLPRSLLLKTLSDRRKRCGAETFWCGGWETSGLSV